MRMRSLRSSCRGLAAAGTTTALVFGSHFPLAQAALFAAAGSRGLRVASGLVVSDHGLLPSLHVSAETAWEWSRELIDYWHGRGLLRYAVTPRFAASCTEEMLRMCGELDGEADGLLFTTHMNETLDEISLVRSSFPWARDYLETYERFGLLGSQSVFAHNVHPTDDELRRLAVAGACVAHCPSSNAFLGSGLFPLRRHVEAGVRVALGSDVGAGTGFGVLKEGLMAYSMQMLLPEGVRLGPAELLWLATGAGAAGLGSGRRGRGFLELARAPTSCSFVRRRGVPWRRCWRGLSRWRSSWGRCSRSRARSRSPRCGWRGRSCGRESAGCSRRDGCVRGRRVAGRGRVRRRRLEHPGAPSGGGRWATAADARAPGAREHHSDPGRTSGV